MDVRLKNQKRDGEQTESSDDPNQAMPNDWSYMAVTVQF